MLGLSSGHLSEALRDGRAALGLACLAAHILLTQQVLGKSVNSSSVRHGAKGGPVGTCCSGAPTLVKPLVLRVG